MTCLKALTLLFGLSAGLHATGEIRLPRLLGDHAVLQRDVPLHIWGWAAPGASLTVSLHGQTVPAMADRIGEWSVFLQPEAAGGPYTLTVQGQGTEGSKQLTDLLIGDVWFASGQSNMEMPLAGFGAGTPIKDGPAEIAAATNPQLRLLLVSHKASDFPLDDLPGGAWTLCTPETARTFSAVAYFFGREIAAKEHVPIGLIDSTWGGTPADSWISLDTLGSDPALLPAFASRARFAANIARDQAFRTAEQKEDAEAKAAGRVPTPHAWHPDSTSWNPAGLYNGMIAPATKLSLKGFLWYQGETNSSPERAPHYAALFQALIADWRARFGQGDLPFLYAQISSFNSPGEIWGTIRDAQRRALALRKTAMAVTLDVGNPNNVHPADKQTVAARLALAARAIVYGETVAYQPPLFRQATPEGPGIRVWFDHAEGLSAHSQAVQGFELAGDDHKFMPATAALQAGTVLVVNPALAHPQYVRYLWSNVTPPALVNAANLPASTFTSEDHPLP